jgi:dipeptidyl aminopeptidase/acylaminoacyl peptidase
VIDRTRSADEDLVAPQLFLTRPGKALVLSEDDKGFTGIHEYDLATLEVGRRLYGSPGFDVTNMIPSPSGDALAGVRYYEDRARTQWLDPDLVKMQEEVDRFVQGGRTEIVSFSDDHSRAIAFIGSADSPGAYYVYDRPSGSMVLLGHRNGAIKMARLHPVRTIRYKARDGLEIAAVLTLPKGKKADLPLIVMPHGGPFARDIEDWDWWAQFLAERGYAVVQPNYRGSSGYGSDLAKRGEGQWGLAMQDDLNDAVAYLAREGIADARRVCIVGASYGGYAAMRAASRDGDLYRCAVSYAGVSDLDRMRRYDSRFLNSGARVDWLKRQAPDFKSVSPIAAPERVSIPLLLVHGVKDTVVPVAQSREFVERLKKAGKDFTYIEQREADHHFSRAEDRLEFLKTLETFLQKHNPA